MCDKDHYFYYNNLKTSNIALKINAYFKKPWKVEESRRIKQPVERKILLR